MASISASIQLYDKVSQPIMKIVSALGNVTDAFFEVEAAQNGTFDTAKIRSARAAYEQAAAGVEDLRNYIDKAGKEQEEFNRKASQGSSVLSGLVKKAAAFVGTYATVQGIKSALNLSDEFTSANARLSLLVDNEAEVAELQEKIFQSAQRSRGAYQDTIATVAKLGLVAGNAFKSNDEMIEFTELLNKNFVVGGASATEQASAMYQLTQAMGSGRLQGDEYRSIIENAPLLAKSIEDYMRNVQGATGTMKEWASEGLLTADVIKAAVFNAADEVESRFNNMPMTWSQVFTRMKNESIMHMQPVLDKINELANNQQFQAFSAGAVGALADVSVYLLEILELASQVASFFSENWSIISPIIMGIVTALGLYYSAMLAYNTITAIAAAITSVIAFAKSVHAAHTMMQAGATFAATAAQYGFNAALLACPITWILLIIIAVIAAIYAIVAAINKLTGSTISATGVIVGAIMSAVAFIWNLFLALLDFILGIINYLVNPWIAFANFFGNLFNDPIASIIHLFGDLADNVLGIVENIAKALDKVFGSDLAASVQGWRDNLGGWIDKAAAKHGNGTYEDVASELNLSSESLGLSRWAYTDAYNTGYDWGANLFSGAEDATANAKVSIPEYNSAALTADGIYENQPKGVRGYDAGQIPSNIASIADNTDTIKDSLDITSEELKYLRDIAETEAVNRFTTAEIRVEMTNNNNVSSDMDLDGMVDYLVVGVNEAMIKAAEGVHS